MDDTAREVARLWTLAQPSVAAFVASQVRDFRDRDDVLQEVAVAVLDGFGTYDRGRPFSAWAVGIARNQVRLYLRRLGRDRRVFREATVDRLEAAFADLSSEDVHALDYLDECLDKLDGRARWLCQLRYRDDLKPAEIGPRIGMSANGVAKALQRIRDALRECVARRAALEASR